MDYKQYIEIDSNIRFGKPVIKSTRISVDDILEMLGNGISQEEILDDFPQLKQEHIFAALKFAADKQRKVAIAS